MHKVLVNFKGGHFHLIPGRVAAVGNISGCRRLSDCRSRGWEFDLGPVPYFIGD